MVVVVVVVVVEEEGEVEEVEVVGRYWRWRKTASQTCSGVERWSEGAEGDGLPVLRLPEGCGPARAVTVTCDVQIKNRFFFRDVDFYKETTLRSLFEFENAK